MAIYMAIRKHPASSSYSIARARDSLARIVHDAEQGQAVELTRRGKAVAAIISVAALEGLRTGRTTFWDALRDFRDRTDLDALWSGGDPFAAIRDRAVGRGVKL